MDPELRWRLDIIIGLLGFIAISILSLVLWLGGFGALVSVFITGLLLGLLVQGLGYSPLPERETQRR